MKVYGLWDTTKKGFASGGYGCSGGITITTFNTKEQDERFLATYPNQFESKRYKIKGISVA